MTTQTEQVLENKLIADLAQLGYEQVKIKNETDLLENFREQLFLHNQENLQGDPLSDQELDRVIQRLIGHRSIYAISQTLHGTYKSPFAKISFERDNGETAYLELLDLKDWRKNHFQVTHQITVQGQHENRYDVTLLINGLPLVQIELKRKRVDISKGMDQILRYSHESYHGLFKAIQLFIVSNGSYTRYTCNNERFNAKFYFKWTDEHNRPIEKLTDFAASFLNPKRLHSVIANYFIFDSQTQNLMVMRPYQIYATEAILGRAKNEPTKNGYVWHTTGSGKTITAFKTSQLLSRMEEAKKIIFLIDRQDLDLQTMKNFNAYLSSENDLNPLDATNSASALVKQLAGTQQKLIITTIQKMNNAIKNKKYAAVLEQYRDQKVIFIEDEAHRTQFGEMRTTIDRWFKQAQHFGFTGTPIFKENMGQSKITTDAMYDDCLHRYLIKDAIRDQNVLPFHIEYYNTITSSHQFTEADDVLVEAIDKKEVMEADERLTAVAQHILKNHHRFTGAKSYNAIFAVPNTRVALKYYNIFKELQAQNKAYQDINIATIFAWEANESTNEANQDKAIMTSRAGLDLAVKDYGKQFKVNVSTDDFPAYFKDVTKRMKDFDSHHPEENIDILIVVDMFLTGFDSKKISTLYVDKKLQNHGLIQAFSRTNRIEDIKKDAGRIYVYRNLKKRTDEALTLFSDGDATPFFRPPYEKIKDQVLTAIKELKAYTPTPDDVYDLFNQGESALAKFVELFLPVIQGMNQIKYYEPFTWEQLNDVLTDDEYETYLGHYQRVYQQAKGRGKQKESILADIDFKIDLIKTDKIDMDYINGLLLKLDLKDKKRQNEQIEFISKMVGRVTSDDLKPKAELIKRFLNEVVPNLWGDEDIIEHLGLFFNNEKQAKIASFSKEHGFLNEERVNHYFKQFEFCGSFDEEALMEELTNSGADPLDSMDYAEELDTFIAENIEVYNFRKEEETNTW